MTDRPLVRFYLWAVIKCDLPSIIMPQLPGVTLLSIDKSDNTTITSFKIEHIHRHLNQLPL